MRLLTTKMYCSAVCLYPLLVNMELKKWVMDVSCPYPSRMSSFFEVPHLQNNLNCISISLGDFGSVISHDAIIRHD